MAFKKAEQENFETTEKENSTGTGKGTAGGKITLAAKGEQIITSMTEEEKAILGSKSNTLIFKGLLGTQKTSQAKTGKGGVREPSYKPVGLKLEVTEDTQIPQFPVTRTRAKDGLDPSEITYVTAKAGETVVLSLFEFMYLVSRPEYSGYVTVGNDPKGGCLGVIAKKFNDPVDPDKLPKPSFNYTNGGTPKDSMTPIDRKNDAGNWEPLPEYAEKFGALYTSSKSMKSHTVKVDNRAAVTAALRDILGI